MSNISRKLEAFSLMRMLPPGAAKVGDVTRQELRDADFGTWAAPCGRTDDLRVVGEMPPSSQEDPRSMSDFDEVLPLDAHPKDDEEAVIELRFSGS